MSSAIDQLSDAVQLHQRGQLDAASGLYRAVLAEDPENPIGLYLAGLLELQSGQATVAAAHLERAVALRPDHIGSLAALGAARLVIGNDRGAVAAAERLLRLEPCHGRAWFILGTALGHLRQRQEAVRALRRAVMLDPAHADAWLNLGNALLEMEELAAAEAHCRIALARDPALAEAHASLGHILCCRRHYDEAIEACSEAIRLRPDFPEAHWNQGIAALLAGDFTTGWANYEWRKRHPSHARDFRLLATPEWQGEPINGLTLLVIAEQGFGDTIQFARYLPLLCAGGTRVVLMCAAPLMPLLSVLAPCFDQAGAVPPHDLWVDQMSLPRLFGTRLETIPSADGYLQPNPARRARWRRGLPPGRLVGLVWAGNPGHSNDRRRSLPVGMLATLRAPNGVHFVSLQVGPRQSEMSGLPQMVDVGDGLTDYAETAAVLGCLDLLISVDTSVVHLAGAIGLPTWLLLPYAPDWRWLPGPGAQPRADSPWYGSLHLIRQEDPGDWEGVIKRVADALVAGDRFPA